MSDWIWQRTGRNTWRAVTQEQAAEDDRLERWRRSLRPAGAGSRGPYMAAHEAEGIEAGVFFADYPEERPQRKG